MMNKRQFYYIKQKLIGVSLLMLTALSMIRLKDATISLVTVPMGLAFIFSKKILFMDGYLAEVQDEKKGSY